MNPAAKPAEYVMSVRKPHTEVNSVSESESLIEDLLQYRM
jgi:hypothetical protein